MKFKVTISNMSNSWEKCIESVVCKVDTPNDSNSRMNDVGNSMEIIGRVGTGEPTCELYSWSLLPTNDSSVTGTWMLKSSEPREKSFGK
jgi:hypothetical protein